MIPFKHGSLICLNFQGMPWGSEEMGKFVHRSVWMSTSLEHLQFDLTCEPSIWYLLLVDYLLANRCKSPTSLRHFFMKEYHKSLQAYEQGHVSETRSTLTHFLRIQCYWQSCLALKCCLKETHRSVVKDSVTRHWFWMCWRPVHAKWYKPLYNLCGNRQVKLVHVEK